MIRYLIAFLFAAGLCYHTTAQSIVGPLSVLPGSTGTYTLDGATYEDAAIWQVYGGTIISGQGTTTVQISWQGDFVDCSPGYITVTEGSNYAETEVTIVMITGGTVSPGTQNILAGQTPATLQCSSAQGPGTTYYWWEYSLNGTDWFSTGAEGASFSPGALSQTTWYQVYIQSGCATTYTNQVVVNVVPLLPAPGNVTASATATRQITLQWVDNTTQEGQYEVYRSAGGNSNYQLLTALPANTTSFVDNNVNGNTTYYYKIKAVSSSNYSGYSNEAYATTGNTLPVITAIADVSMHYNTNLVIPVSVSDIDNGTLVITVPGLPGFASFVPSGNGSGEIHITTPGMANAGTHAITISVTDAHGGTAQRSFNLVIVGNNPPELQPVANITIEENDQRTINLSASDAESIQGAIWSFPNGLPAFVTHTPVNDANGQLVIKPGEGTVGTYSITIKVQDSDGAWDTKTFTITVIPETLKPSIITYFSGQGLLAATVARGGICNSAYEYQWQITENPASNPYQDILQATRLNLLPNVSSGTYYYRLKITCNGVTVYSNEVNVTPVTPSLSVNSYIKTFDFLKPGVTAGEILNPFALKDAKETYQYVDELGRLSQSIIKKGSFPSGGNPVDLIKPVTYDMAGREAYKHLSFVANTAGGNTSLDDGKFKSQPLVQQQAFYNDPNGVLKGQGETYFYSKTDYEPSPLNRVDKVMAPGNNWVGGNRGIANNYWTNTDDDVKIWTVTNGSDGLGSYSVTGVYGEGELYKKITTDEQDKQVIEFRDKEDKVILKKVQLTAIKDNGDGKDYTGWLCTYYIYDELNRLRAVVAPRGVELLISVNWDITQLNGDILNEQCFRYAYDARGRMIRKKNPGAGEVWMVYDAKDRLVLTQHANLRAATTRQWLYTTYDGLNRPVTTGLITDPANYNNLSFHIQQAEGSAEYPNLANYTTEELTHTYYDNYNWASSLSAPVKDFDIGYANSYLLTATDKVWPYPQAIQNSSRTLGMVTGSKVKVLGDTKYITTVNFYDEKGRLMQSRSENMLNGIDVATTQYAWNGAPLLTVYKQEIKGSNVQTSIIATKINYDDLGRIISIGKKASNSLANAGVVPATWTTVSQHEYDVLGQRIKKKVGNQPTGTALANLNYEYNIRGWLLSVNKDYITGSDNDAYFGMQLGYDKNGNLGTFSPLYNGNISGVIWKSEGDKQKRKYDFSYDATNRLTGASFTQYVSGSGTSAIFDLSEKLDFSVSNLTYDANGNIKTMQQNGWKFGGSAPIDNLQYNYQNNNSSNRLASVTDLSTGGTSPTASAGGGLGDFSDRNTNGDDYGYDANGNLVTDLNKRINGATGSNVSSGGAIVYNHLNLPVQITVKDNNGDLKGTISYTYDAAGTKLKKVAIDVSNPNKAITTTTTYIGGLVYETKTTSPVNTPDDNYIDVLQFISHEEGRVRFTPPHGNSNAKLDYDYFIKDHLGNIRMVLTEEEAATPYTTLSFEGVVGSAEVQEQDRDWENKNGQSINVAGVRVVKEFGNGSPTGNNAMLVRKSTGAIGSAKLLKVMAGDRIHTSVDYFYAAINADNSPANGIGSLVASFVNALSGSTAISGTLKEAAGPVTSSLGLNSMLSGLLNTPNDASSGNQAPKAYLNILFFDDQFKFDDVNSIVIPVAYKPNEKGTISKMAADALEAKKNGYVYVYFSNETEELVYFDNFRLTHERGRILEEAHYYPFGLTMAGISSKAIGKLENKNEKFQSQPLDDDLGLNWYGFKWRNHDPQIGRFIQIDPLADKYVYNSTYAFSENKVTSGFELEGLEFVYGTYPDAGNTRAVANLFRPKSEQTPMSQILNDSRAEYSAKWKLAPLVIATMMQPELAIPFIISYLSGLPVMPSPQAMSGTVASELSIMETATSEMSQAELLVTKARIFEAGGEIGMMEGAANLAVDTKTGFFNIQVNAGAETGIITGEINIAEGVIGFSNIEITNAKGGLGSISQQNTIGPEVFMKLQRELTELTKAGGYNKATLEYSRLRPVGSRLPDTDTRIITLFDNTHQ